MYTTSVEMSNDSIDEDAIGGAMLQVNKELNKMKKAYRSSVMICILTDGEENRSQTFSKSDVKSMVEIGHLHLLVLILMHLVLVWDMVSRSLIQCNLTRLTLVKPCVLLDVTPIQLRLPFQRV